MPWAVAVDYDFEVTSRSERNKTASATHADESETPPEKPEASGAVPGAAVARRGKSTREGGVRAVENLAEPEARRRRPQRSQHVVVDDFPA